MRAWASERVLSAILLIQLNTYMLSETAASPAPPASGVSAPVMPVEENAVSEFSCRLRGWKSEPVVTWYLDGVRQEGRPGPVAAPDANVQSRSTFVVTARRGDRELNCSATDPETGLTYNASLTLDVQFKPEVVEMNAEYREDNISGLFLVLFVLVRANPPANITWVDESGQVVVNTSNFMIMDTKSYPWLTNHTVHVQMSSLPHNYSFTAGNHLGTTHSSIPPPGFLEASVEVPLMVILLGGGLGLFTILLLNVLVLCVIYRRHKPLDLKQATNSLLRSDPVNVTFEARRLPRDHLSLPSHLHIQQSPDANSPRLPEVRVVAWPERDPPSDQDSSISTEHKGLVRFPMYGFIYKVSSLSSDEIWL